MLPLALFAALVVGEPAPEIRLDRLFPDRPPAEAALPSLRGRAVVLDFWATWCGPCVAAIPHWNKLVEQFRGQPVVFLSVSDEPPETIEKFLAKKPIQGWVGAARELKKAYGVNGIPRTILIDAQGRAAGELHTARLTAKMVEDLAAGRPVDVPAPPKPVSLRGDPESATPLLDVVLRPTTTADDRKAGAGRGAGELTFKALPLRNLLLYLWGVPPGRIVGEAVDDPTRYDLSVKLPGAGREQLDALAKAVVESAFHISAVSEMREADVWVLTAPNGKPAGLVEAEPQGGIFSSTGRNSAGIRNGSFASFALLLERPAGKPVIDETGIDGRYDLKLQWEEGKLEEAVARLGLKLSPGRRRVEYLAISKTK